MFAGESIRLAAELLIRDVNFGLFSREGGNSSDTFRLISRISVHSPEAFFGSRQASVYYRDIPAAILRQDADGYSFEYFPAYLENPALPAISLTLPKRGGVFRSGILFPFFFGLLAEADNKTLQCRLLRIDENDHFTRLLRTCAADTIGGVTVREIS